MTESEIDAARKICEVMEQGSGLAKTVAHLDAAAILPRALDALEAANRRIAELEGQIADLADEHDDLEDTLNAVVECTSRDTTKEPNP